MYSTHAGMPLKKKKTILSTNIFIWKIIFMFISSINVNFIIKEKNML